MKMKIEKLGRLF